MNTFKSFFAITALILIVSLSLLAAAPAAYACSCMVPGSPTEELAKSAAVFSGRVTSIASDSSGYGYKVKFEIERSWKSIVGENTTVSTARDSAGCGFTFTQGMKYVVYAYDAGGSLSTGLCSRTHLLQENDPDVAALEKTQTFPITTYEYNFGASTLRSGSKGSAVGELQKFLNNTSNSGLIVDGKMGPKTILAVKKWQNNNGLLADGLVGPQTKAKMYLIVQSVIKSNANIDAFVKEASLPKNQGVRIFIDVPTQNLKVFSITYGEPQDCPAGCFFSHATGVEYGNKIGWISVEDYDEIDTSRLIMYNFDISDTYLYTDEFSQSLKSKSEWIYQYAFLPELAKDKDVPKNVLLKIANGLSSYIQPSLANNLLDNIAVQNDPEILTIIANLPISSYEEVRIRAQALLD